jgi:hypothetical protein
MDDARLVSLCHDNYVQRLIFGACMNKKLVTARALRRLRAGVKQMPRRAVLLRPGDI